MPNPDALHIGIDLGGTNVTVGVLDARDKLVARAKTKTKAQEGPNAVLQRIVNVVHEALDESHLPIEQVGGLCIGAPGTIDLKTGVVSNAVNLCWDSFDIGPRLARELGVPVTLDNDVNVGAWGEYVLGASRGYEDNLAVFVGTGIGGGFVINGKLYHGHFMTSGEIGQTTLFPDAALGKRTLEQHASRTAVVNQIKALILSNHPSKISKLTEGDLDNIRSKMLARAVDENDELTTEVLRDSARYVGIAIANAVTLLSLPCVVLGGGLTEALGDVYVKWVRQAFEHAVHPRSLAEEVHLVASKLGDDAGLIGAALLARERFS